MVSQNQRNLGFGWILDEASPASRWGQLLTWRKRRMPSSKDAWQLAQWKLSSGLHANCLQCWSSTSKTLKQEFQEVNMNSMHPGSSVACNSTAVPSTFTFQVPKSCSSNLVATWKHIKQRRTRHLYKGMYICTSWQSQSQPRWISRA